MNLENAALRRHLTTKKWDIYTDVNEKSAKMWGEFLDFNFYEFNIKNSLYVKGFGKAYKEVH